MVSPDKIAVSKPSTVGEAGLAESLGLPDAAPSTAHLPPRAARSALKAPGEHDVGAAAEKTFTLVGFASNFPKFACRAREMDVGCHKIG
ncbi:hypothetical protein MDOR_15230 [Mycolicibacterium doricum]|uniref:Uncharacterized protein n=1 Tax=Mycolicibacterium doricum TaxID=126673 RepID=A0A7I7VQ06_9MYCO|nr:hypothetical protein MDOR_15230 [Mycolicibacterium doricum]